ncbi:MAG: septum formation initiator family protein [Bacteroidetes bacterium]|jgi:cell division protein DivIC|nr:septum formation initiator family protein [Bacteroidota bacterium]HMT36228.1 septum formation initiator family protein [Chitinophagaceae bacterium]MBK6820091.1 septum formation initiator family protein [Bacteroidota bacterium]MBK7041452.1 septum formation initiator family protein [Bacteroidota bacterium]MBK7587983.1 septum formation initiator family protein [Bacteroidota bacterium]
MQLFNLLKNKFLIITVIFIVWVFFFAQYDIISLRKQRAELKEMNEKINYLEKEVARLHDEKNALKHDSTIVEKYAREKYFMKTDHEDVYMLDTNIVKPIQKKK